MNDLPDCEIRGEAVVVDVKQHGYIFLVFDSPRRHSRTAMVTRLLSAATASPYTASNRDLPIKWSLNSDQMPRIIRFENISDPYSAQDIGPEAFADGLGARGATIYVEVEKTKSDVSFGSVASAIPWVKNPKDPFYNETYRDMKEVNPVSQSLSIYDFISGESK